MAQSFTGKVEIQPDGDVKMYTKPTAPGAEPDRDYKIYQRRGKKTGCRRVTIIKSP